MSTLSISERHDLKTALLSIKWCAELLTPADNSQPPIKLIAEHLLKSYERLSPVVEALLESEEGTES
ncbi:MAG: hypothetical protein RJB13_265 [Pseudomonadota bacterium]